MLDMFIGLKNSNASTRYRKVGEQKQKSKYKKRLINSHQLAYCHNKNCYISSITNISHYKI